MGLGRCGIDVLSVCSGVVKQRVSVMKPRIGKIKARSFRIARVEEERILQPAVIAEPEPFVFTKPIPKPAPEPRRKITVSAVRAAVYDSFNKLAPFNITFYGVPTDFWNSKEGLDARESALKRHKLSGYSLKPFNIK